MAARGTRQLALDTNVLMDLAAGLPVAISFLEKFQNEGFSLRVPPTVLMELAYHLTGNDARRKELAGMALRSMQDWKITPVVLTEVERCYRKNFVGFVQDRGVLPPKEENDALILAEVGIAGIQGFVTSDRAILEADVSELNRAFKDSGISPVIPVEPRKLLASLR